MIYLGFQPDEPCVQFLNKVMPAHQPASQPVAHVSIGVISDKHAFQGSFQVKGDSISIPEVKKITMKTANHHHPNQSCRKAVTLFITDIGDNHNSQAEYSGNDYHYNDNYDNRDSSSM